MKNVAENRIKDQEWTILRNGPFLVIFLTVSLVILKCKFSKVDFVVMHRWHDNVAVPNDFISWSAYTISRHAVELKLQES